MSARHCHLVGLRPKALQRHAPRCRVAPFSLPVRRQDDSWMAEQLCSVSPAPEEAQVDNLVPPPSSPVFTALPPPLEITSPPPEFVAPPPSSLDVSPALRKAQVDNLVPPPLPPVFIESPSSPEFTLLLPPPEVTSLLATAGAGHPSTARAVQGRTSRRRVAPANAVATSTVSPQGYSYTPPAHLSAASPTCGFASTPPPLDHTPSPPRMPRAGCTITADVATQTDAPAPRRNLRRSIDRPHLCYLQPYPSHHPGVNDYDLLVDIRQPHKLWDNAHAAHIERRRNTRADRHHPSTIRKAAAGAAS